MSRSIQQIDDGVSVVKLEDSGGNGNSPLLFELHPVGGGMALSSPRLDCSRLMDRASVEQQLFRKSGFTRVRVGNDGEIAPLLNSFGNLVGGNSGFSGGHRR